MGRIIKYVSITVALVVCVVAAYESWLEIRYNRKIPQYLGICMEQSVPPSVEHLEETPTKQNPSENVYSALKTELGMSTLALRLAGYAHDNGYLPKSLEELGLERKYLVDAWSNKFEYVRESEQTFILCSPGGDRVFQGKVANGEIAGRYSLDVFKKQVEGNAILLRYIMNRGYLGEAR